MGKNLKGKEIGKGIRQLKNGKYEARYIDRFGKRKSLYATSLSLIRQKLNDEQKKEAERKNVKTQYTVKQWYEEWMETYKRPSIRNNSYLYYKGVFIKHILPEIEFLDLNEVREMHIKTILNHLDQAGYGWTTMNKVKILLVDLFNVAIANDYAIRNPAKGVRIPKNRPNDRIVLTTEQQEAFLDCSSGTFYNNLFVVSLNSGMRPGEITALKRGDIDFHNHTIKIERTLIYQKWETDTQKTFHLGPPKTYTSNRIIPMNSICEEAIRKQLLLKQKLSLKYKKDDEFKDLIFVTKFNTPICSQTFCDAIKRIVDEINLQRDETDQMPTFSPHTFRHTFATRCIESGIQPKVLQKYLGHATLQMTMDLYVHVTDDFKKEELCKLASAFPKIQGKIIPINGVQVG